MRAGGKIKKIYTKMLLYIAAMIMFVSVVIIYYRHLDSETRENIINAGRINALESSHEIRTPINAILGMNEMILRETDDESVLEYSENIKSAGNSLLGIINDILDFSKIEAGKIEIIPVDYDLSSVINDLVNMIHTRADNKGLELKLDFD